MLLAAGLVAAWLWIEHRSRDVRGSATTEFVTRDVPGVKRRPKRVVREEPWPTYGYDVRRTRYARDFRLRPPFRTVWAIHGRSLLEFPPVVAYGRLYVGTNEGRFLALDAHTGRIAWQKHFGRCIAASATVADGFVYQPLMDPSPCVPHDQDAPGFVVALDADNGRPRWRFRAGVIESPPLLVDGVLYFGSWDGKLYAIQARTSRVRWTFATGDKVKGGAAFSDGRVYVGSFDGNVYSLDARTGRTFWSAHVQPRLGTEGNFYATPAVAYGRVFIGATDGKVYAFGAKSGNLLWATSTGGYVYSSAAVWRRTVYVGSYDRNLYALDAATGGVRWRFRAGGAISGSPTVLAGVVYFSTLSARTYALDARNGRLLWTFPDGQYTPLVADRRRVYLTGYAKVYGLVPKRARRAARPRKRPRAGARLRREPTSKRGRGR